MKKLLSYTLILASLTTSCDTGISSANDEYILKRISHMDKQISFLERRISEIEKQNTDHGRTTSPVVKRNITFELDDGYFDDPFFGSEGISRIMIIYTDLQCTACKSFLSETLPELKKHFSKSDSTQVRIRDFPLAKTPLSKHLAMGAHCAGEKGRYWDFISAMLTMSINNENDVIRIAELIPSLDVPVFKSCIASGKYEREIEMDKAHGKAIGIKGTPGIIIGKKIDNRLYSGTMIRGNQPLGLLLNELEFLNQPQGK